MAGAHPDRGFHVVLSGRGADFHGDPRLQGQPAAPCPNMKKEAMNERIEMAGSTEDVKAWPALPRRQRAPIGILKGIL